MREIKLWAGLGTILIFAGVYCFKALSGQTKKSHQVMLILSGTIAIIAGVYLLFLSFKKI